MHDTDHQTGNNNGNDSGQIEADTASSRPQALWQATVLTLFPEMFPGPLGYSLAGKSLNDGIWALKTLDLSLIHI